MKNLIKLPSKTVIGERHFFRAQKEEWLERDPTNDAGAGKQSEKGGEEAMLQSYRRQLHPAGRAGPLPLPAADHALADLPLVSRGSSSGWKRTRAGADQKRRAKTLRGVRKHLLLRLQSEQILCGLRRESEASAAGGIRTQETSL